MTHIAAVMLEIHETQFELDLAGRDVHQVLTAATEMVRSMSAGRGPAAAEFRVRPPSGQGPAEVLYVPSEVLCGCRVIGRVA
jgi:hypothetical protein